MRLLPQSLFGRLMLVLSAGLILAQLLSAAINLVERDSLLVRASGMQPAQRIADIVTLLDSLTPAERARIVGILNVPPLVVSLDRAPASDESAATGGAHAAMFSSVLRNALGDDRPIRVAVSGTPPQWAPGAGRGRGQGPMGAGAMGGPGMHRFPPDGVAFLIQVRLQDGTWATFDTQVSQASASLPWRVLLTLAILLAAVLLLSWVAVRWVTRPLQLLATAADELGRDINRPPLPEGGPAEVSRAARAFNTMQTRLVEVHRRADAPPHRDVPRPQDAADPDATARRTAGGRQPAREIRSGSAGNGSHGDADAGIHARASPTASRRNVIDIMGLLERLRAENEAMGRNVTIEGRVTRSLTARSRSSQALPLEPDRQRCPLRSARGDCGRGRRQTC